MICVMLDGRTREMDLFLKEQGLPEPYGGSPVYSGSVAVLPNRSLQVIAWGTYVFVSSLTRTWLPRRMPTPLSKPLVTLEVISSTDEFISLKIINGKASRKVKLKL
jgi:hypothetical protein